MKSIHSSMIISAFENHIDQESLEYYRKKSDLTWEPIIGYESIIDEQDVFDNKFFISGEEIQEKHIGLKCLYVVDGHHRSIVGNEIGINLCYEEII